MAWYNQSWLYRVKVTVQASKVPASATFPVYVNLNSLPAGFHSHVNQTDARDIRVTTSDGVTEIPREVVFYTAASDTGEMYFKGAISSSSNTDFYIYYGNASASEPAANSTYGSQNVWDSNFKAVYHMKDYPGNNAYIWDSTANGKTGTKSGGANSPSQTGGLVGVSQYFNNSNYIALGALGPTSSNTVSLILNHPLPSNIPGDFARFAWTTDDNYALFYRKSTQVVEFKQTTTAGGGTRPTLSQAYLGNNSWFHLACGYTSGTPYIMSNGVRANGSNTGNLSNNNTWCIGSSANTIYGYVDEFRVSDIDRGTNWLTTEYNNLVGASTFYAIGTEEFSSVKKIAGVLLSSISKVSKLGITSIKKIIGVSNV